MVDYNGPVQGFFRFMEALWVLLKKAPWLIVNATPKWLVWVGVVLFFVFGCLVLWAMWVKRDEWLRRKIF